MAGECLQTRFAKHGLTPQKAPKRCPTSGVWRMLWGSASRHGLLDTVKKHMADVPRTIFRLFFLPEKCWWKFPQLAIPDTQVRLTFGHLTRSTVDTEMKVKLIPKIVLRFRFRIYILIILIGQMIFRIHVHIDTSPRITPGHGEVRVYRGTGVSRGVPHTLGYACTFNAPTSPLPIHFRFRFRNSEGNLFGNLERRRSQKIKVMKFWIFTPPPLPCEKPGGFLVANFLSYFPKKV